ncbi:MAG: glycosyl hydrolase family 18 protein [Veillonellales bacterium]
MKSYKVAFIWFLVIAMFAVMNIPSAPVYAFSARDLLGQTTGASIDDNVKGVSSGGGLADLLLGLLFGKLFGNILNTNADSSKDVGSSSAWLSGTGTKEIAGFYAEWWGEDTSSYKDMVSHTDVLKTIIPFWATLQEDGTVTERGGNDHSSVVKTAHQNHISVLLMVNNATEGKTATPIHTVLTDPALRTKAVDSIETYIKKYDLDGINIDFESVPAQDRNQLSAFMKELSARLKPQGYVISIDVFPKQDESNDIAMAYDYAQLAKSADKIMIMTYDYHGSWSDAGPVADVRWVENCLRYALQFIPKNKIYLGIAGYGYDWSSKGVESLEYQPIMNLVQRFNVPVLWDQSAKSPHFSYTGTDGITHQVWYENKESLQYKLDLVNQYDIAGTALWKLGEEDPGYWQVFKDKLLKK